MTQLAERVLVTARRQDSRAARLKIHIGNRLPDGNHDSRLGPTHRTSDSLIDCCTREITAWSLDVRCRAAEAAAVVDAAVAVWQVRPNELTLGTDNATALTARAFRARLCEHGIVHRRGGYRDPDSQAFIESWFSKLKERCVWREQFETLEQARHAIAAYVDGYHHRPHSGLAYRTPREVAATRKAHDDQLTPAARPDNTDGVHASSASLAVPRLSAELHGCEPAGGV